MAVVTGAAMGGELVLAAACDLRLITPRARFGVPIARTVGNCLSVANTARLVASLGVNRAKRMLLLAEIMDAGEAVACGFALEIVAPEEIDRRAAELAGVLSSNAPLTLRVAKEAIRRLAATGLPNGDDLVRLAYGSGDFKEGVSAFLERGNPSGREDTRHRRDCHSLSVIASKAKQSRLGLRILGSVWIASLSLAMT